MSRFVSFFALWLCLLVLSSCSGVAAVATLTAFGIEAYEEARIHRPDLKLEPISKITELPDLQFFSDQFLEDYNKILVEVYSTKQRKSKDYAVSYIKKCQER